MLEKILRTIEKFIPKKIYRFFQPAYHFFLAVLGALIYRLPGLHLKVVGVTGTKGKTSTVELINAILEEAQYKTAIASTLRFKIGKEEKRNLFKMTMPGRFFVQKILRQAVKENCDYAIVEITSEGAKQFRHLFLSLNALIFTNLSPEHIESHGSFEKYKNAKLSIVKELERSWKKPHFVVVNGDDQHGKDFLNFKIENKSTFSLKDVEPFKLHESGIDFTLGGGKIHSKLSGEFNLYNILAAITFAKSQNISNEVIKRALEKFDGIRGRVEKIDIGQNFTVVVDYAHTADSMEKVYKVFENHRKICVFGATGGGRDKWKRPEMGRVADTYCEEIILTDDDSYDENPEEIARAVALGIKNKVPTILINRREAIREGLKRAKSGDVVLITGKGTDPYLMGPNGTKIEWDDATITKEELSKLIHARTS